MAFRSMIPPLGHYRLQRSHPVQREQSGGNESPKKLVLLAHPRFYLGGRYLLTMGFPDFRTYTIGDPQKPLQLGQII
jgi:hypothetical protein